jgi:hypothetical protein
LKGLSSLQWLNLEGNWINVIPDFCKDGLHNLTRLRLSSTKLYTLNHLRNHTKFSRMLKMSKRNCWMHLDVFWWAGMTFYSLLEHLMTEASRIYCIQFSSKLIRDMFTPLKKLTSIWLESMYLAYMPTYFFNRFPLLTYISHTVTHVLRDHIWDKEKVA